MFEGYELVSVTYDGRYMTWFWQRPVEQDPRAIFTASLSLDERVCKALSEKYPRLGDLCAAEVSELSYIIQTVTGDPGRVFSDRHLERLRTEVRALGLELGLPPVVITIRTP